MTDEPCSSENIPESVLQRKLHAPIPNTDMVQRLFLKRDFKNILGKRLVLFRAPAGFGKSTAMLQLRNKMADEGITTSWLTLDDFDNNLSRFMSSIRAAMELVFKNDSNKKDKLNSGVDLLEAITEFDGAFSLFLDEFEVIKDPSVIAFISEVINNLSVDCQIVIGSRVIPGVGLPRLRARQSLFEIDQDQLRFSKKEASEFLTKKCHFPLDRKNITDLQQATEGWVTALTLASMMLIKRGKPTEIIGEFSGATNILADYLAEDVLAGLESRLREFLLETSILSELNAPLCDYIRGREDSAEILEKLEKLQLFIVPLDSESYYYRYHNLFAEFLRSQLRRRHPEKVKVLHRAAAEWYLDQQRPVAAIKHALVSGDQHMSVAILSKYAQEYLRKGRARLLSQWMAKIDEDLLRPNPKLRAIQMWGLFFSQEPETAYSILENIDSDPNSHESYKTIQDDLLALRPLLLLRMDKFDKAFEIGVKNLALFSNKESFAYSILLNSIATMQIVEDKKKNGFLLKIGHLGDEENSISAIFSACSEGLIDLIHGRLRQAKTRFGFAEQHFQKVSSTERPEGNTVAAVFSAVVQYEQNEWDKAERRLKISVDAIKDQGFPDQIIISNISLAKIFFCRGDIDRAWDLLTELEYIGRVAKSPRILATARLTRSRFLLMRGDLMASEKELEKANDQALWDKVGQFSLIANDLDNYTIARLRLMIHKGESELALPMIIKEKGLAKRQCRLRRLLLLGIFHAIALREIGDQDAALTEFFEVLKVCSDEGFSRLVLDEGEKVAELLRLMGAVYHPKDIDQKILKYVDQLLLSFSQDVEESGQADALSDSRLVEALTRKEFSVLKLLSEGLSNEEMSKRLFVSDSTVRTHLRNINSKLGARNRTQAVAIARRLGLIS